MVKKAEVQRKRSPLLPVFGLILAVALFAIAYGVTDLVILKIPGVYAQVASQLQTARIAFSFGIWLVLMAIVFFLVALLTGKDPDKAPPLPPKDMFRGGKRR
ncbi:MAG: hypothetical protein IT324_09535 [Anaerolineae bacterium]|nr:hypothetical protein [Anaerolineae bacterium]